MPEINYRIATTSLQSTSTIQYSPTTGIINSCILHFPLGCNSLVEVFLNIRTVQILPAPTRGTGTTNIGIALDDTTQSFNIGVHVNKDDPIEIAINNHDDAEDHTISAIILIEKEKTYTGP